MEMCFNLQIQLINYYYYSYIYFFCCDVSSFRTVTLHSFDGVFSYCWFYLGLLNC